MGKVLFSQVCVCPRGERGTPDHLSVVSGPRFFPEGEGSRGGFHWSLVPGPLGGGGVRS